MQICNDNTYRISVPGYKVAFLADRTLTLCCNFAGSQSGQMFHPQEGWNAIVGYANCNHKLTHRPAWYGGNGGPNGMCVESGIKGDEQFS